MPRSVLSVVAKEAVQLLVEVALAQYVKGIDLISSGQVAIPLVDVGPVFIVIVGPPGRSGRFGLGPCATTCSHLLENSFFFSLASRLRPRFTERP